MSIRRAACERAGRTSARVPDATRCGGESSEAVITHKIIRGMLGVIGSRWFPSKPANAVGLCGALQSSRTHAVCAVRCAAVVPVVALPTVVPVARADVTQPPRAAAAAAKRF